MDEDLRRRAVEALISRTNKGGPSQWWTTAEPGGELEGAG